MQENVQDNVKPVKEDKGMISIKSESFIFPKALAKKMAHLSPLIQAEANIISTSWLILGLLLTMGYVIFGLPVTTWFKVITVINTIAGMTLLSMQVVSHYQQYRSIREALLFSLESEMASQGQASSTQIDDSVTNSQTQNSVMKGGYYG